MDFQSLPSEFVSVDPLSGTPQIVVVKKLSPEAQRKMDQNRDEILQAIIDADRINREYRTFVSLTQDFLYANEDSISDTEEKEKLIDSLFHSNYDHPDFVFQMAAYMGYWKWDAQSSLLLFRRALDLSPAYLDRMEKLFFSGACKQIVLWNFDSDMLAILQAFPDEMAVVIRREMSIRSSPEVIGKYKKALAIIKKSQKIPR